MLGKITKCATTHNTGVIDSKIAGGSFRFSTESLSAGYLIAEGDLVDFRLGSLNGVPQAVDVRLLSKAEKPAQSINSAPPTIKARPSYGGIPTHRLAVNPPQKKIVRASLASPMHQSDGATARPSIIDPSLHTTENREPSHSYKGVYCDLHRGIPIERKSPPRVSLHAPASISEENAQHSVDESGRVQCNSCGKLMIPRMNLYRGLPERSFCPFCGVVHKDFRLKTSCQPEKRSNLLADLFGMAVADLALYAIVGLVILIFMAIF